jgi:hypothetical protein
MGTTCQARKRKHSRSSATCKSKKEFVPSYRIATVYIGLGMKEEALQYLIKAYEEGSYYT